MKDRIVERIWSRDFTLWKPKPDEISNRLGWLSIADEMLGSLDALEEFARDCDQFESLVLAGMGGSSLAPEVFDLTFGRASERRLYVLDTTHPATIGRVTSEIDPAQTLFIISSKSGGTIETLSHFAHFWSILPDGSNYVAITDPGSPLEKLANDHHFRQVFYGAPDIGGRYSALSNFGLIPGALVGAPLRDLLEGAIEMAGQCRSDDAASNPGLALGTAIGEASIAGRDKLILDLPDEISAFGYWIEQLIAESTGKEGKGILPVEGDPPGDSGDDRFVVSYRGRAGGGRAGGAGGFDLDFDGVRDLGGECFRWEFATAVAGAIIGINAFDQPNVQEAKDATSRILAGGDELGGGRGGARAAAGDRAGGDGAGVLPDLDGLLATARPADYIAIQAFADRTPEAIAALTATRRVLRDQTGLATTVGFGPRYLHSTGQYHKGGPNTGLFIQAVDDAPGEYEDIPIPEKAFTFGQLMAAQAQGDIESLLAHGRRICRVSMAELVSIGGAR